MSSCPFLLPEKSFLSLTGRSKSTSYELSFPLYFPMQLCRAVTVNHFPWKDYLYLTGKRTAKRKCRSLGFYGMGRWRHFSFLRLFGGHEGKRFHWLSDRFIMTNVSTCTTMFMTNNMTFIGNDVLFKLQIIIMNSVILLKPFDGSWNKSFGIKKKNRIFFVLLERNTMQFSDSFLVFEIVHETIVHCFHSYLSYFKWPTCHTVMYKDFPSVPNITIDVFLDISGLC